MPETILLILHHLLRVNAIAVQPFFLNSQNQPDRLCSRQSHTAVIQLIVTHPAAADRQVILRNLFGRAGIVVDFDIVKDAIEELAAVIVVAAQFEARIDTGSVRKAAARRNQCTIVVHSGG